ncbi:FAD-binding domain-containing protein [Hyphomicrobium sulfonivorans]|uniref:FAD-binding domain-containing protein n=1 Tax=Hyphomicrobium sulfonivorans TaxID=121290 RepID=UPI00156EE9F5|nr:deoxyribodipyrimidine photo-lyase [Hyphomicrobium sulfonivorans]NSL71218.1 deoxyribodipyrimidine photolyase [Hyphomicrobium sulfonivorans]
MARDHDGGDCVDPVIVWFRDDLRLADNPALHAAAQSGRPLICLFVYQTDDAIRPLGGAARWWLHGSLLELDRALRAMGGELLLFSGSAAELIPHLAGVFQAHSVFWNRRYGAAERKVDEGIKSKLKASGIEAKSFNGHLLYEPWTVATKSNAPFRVFSAFWRAALATGEPGSPLPTPSRPDFSSGLNASGVGTTKLTDLRLEPRAPDWAKGLRANWQHGEAGAQKRLDEFLDEGFSSYAVARDRPDRSATSRLSPYLRFGNISVRQVWHAVADHAIQSGSAGRAFEKFQSELGWREFSYHLLYHNPDMAERNLQPKFDNMPWRDDRDALKAWQRGMTGYPLVDAGMRELWATGWMHNRVRMVVASFLIKDLLIDWRNGEAWFWDTLVDADAANNAASWQWVAGSGADAAPFFRIFNPVLQGEKFDPDGAYVRRWVPELAKLPNSIIHRPWEAAKKDLLGMDSPGVNYPARIVDHRLARERALAAFRSLA